MKHGNNNYNVTNRTQEKYSLLLVVYICKKKRKEIIIDRKTLYVKKVTFSFLIDISNICKVERNLASYLRFELRSKY